MKMPSSSSNLPSWISGSRFHTTTALTFATNVFYLWRMVNEMKITRKLQLEGSMRNAFVFTHPLNWSAEVLWNPLFFMKVYGKYPISILSDGTHVPKELTTLPNDSTLFPTFYGLTLWEVFQWPWYGIQRTQVYRGLAMWEAQRADPSTWDPANNGLSSSYGFGMWSLLREIGLSPGTPTILVMVCTEWILKPTRSNRAAFLGLQEERLRVGAYLLAALEASKFISPRHVLSVLDVWRLATGYRVSGPIVNTLDPNNWVSTAHNRSNPHFLDHWNTLILQESLSKLPCLVHPDLWSVIAPVDAQGDIVRAQSGTLTEAQRRLIVAWVFQGQLWWHGANLLGEFGLQALTRHYSPVPSTSIIIRDMQQTHQENYQGTIFYAAYVNRTGTDPTQASVTAMGNVVTYLAGLPSSWTPPQPVVVTRDLSVTPSVNLAAADLSVTSQRIARTILKAGGSVRPSIIAPYPGSAISGECFYNPSTGQLSSTARANGWKIVSPPSQTEPSNPFVCAPYYGMSSSLNTRGIQDIINLVAPNPISNSIVQVVWNSTSSPATGSPGLVTNLPTASNPVENYTIQIREQNGTVTSITRTWPPPTDQQTFTGSNGSASTLIRRDQIRLVEYWPRAFSPPRAEKSLFDLSQKFYDASQASILVPRLQPAAYSRGPYNSNDSQSRGALYTVCSNGKAPVVPSRSGGGPSGARSGSSTSGYTNSPSYKSNRLPAAGSGLGGSGDDGDDPSRRNHWQQWRDAGTFKDNTKGEWVLEKDPVPRSKGGTGCSFWRNTWTGLCVWCYPGSGLCPMTGSRHPPVAAPGWGFLHRRGMTLADALNPVVQTVVELQNPPNFAPIGTTDPDVIQKYDLLYNYCQGHGGEWVIDCEPPDLEWVDFHPPGLENTVENNGGTVIQPIPFVTDSRINMVIAHGLLWFYRNVNTGAWQYDRPDNLDAANQSFINCNTFLPVVAGSSGSSGSSGAGTSTDPLVLPNDAPVQITVDHAGTPAVASPAIQAATAAPDITANDESTALEAAIQAALLPRPGTENDPAGPSGSSSNSGTTQELQEELAAELGLLVEISLDD